MRQTLKSSTAKIELMLPDNCNFCAACCSLYARLGKSEIAAIKKKGYKESYFVELDPEGKKVLRHVNNYCIFLEIKEGRGFCRVYDARPKECRLYPSKKICTLKLKIDL